MKKILLGLMTVLGVMVLVACGPTKRDQDPVLKGVKSTVSINVGDDYDPKAGITAFESADKNAKEITKDIKHTFNSEWTEKAGIYSYTVSITNKAERTVSATVNLTVIGDDAEVGLFDVITGPNAITYYQGSTEFDPLEEMTGYNTQTEEEVEVFLKEETYSTAVVGTHTFEVTTVSEDREVGSTKVVTLHVKPKVNILTELPKDTAAPIKVEMWHSNGTTIENQLKAYATSFNAEMKAKGYNVQVDIVKNGGNYDELRTNVINALKGGTLPHIVQNYPDHVVEYAKSDVITSLNPYINHPIHGYDKNNNSEKFTDILESYRAEQRATNDQGDYISLPFNKSTEVVTYNKTAYDQVLKGASFPETWQDLFEYTDDLKGISSALVDNIASKYQAANKAMTADEIAFAKDKFVPMTYDSSSNAFITLTRQFGGKYTSRNSQGVGVLEFDNAQTKEMLTYFGEQRGKGFAVPPYWGEGIAYGNAVSKHGTTVFSIGSTGGIHYNTPVESGHELFKVGVAPVPYDRFNPNSRSVIQQGTNVSMTTQGTEAEKLAAWYFIKYLTSNAIQEKFSLATGYSPIRDSVYSNQGFLDYIAQADRVMKGSAAEEGLSVGDYQKAYETHVKAMGLKIAMEQRNYQFYDQPFVGSSGARAAVGVAFERVMLAPAGADLQKVIADAIAAAIAEAEKGIA